MTSHSKEFLKQICQSEQLPASVKQMLEVLSMESTLRIVARYGGTRLRITTTPNNDLIDLLGGEQAKILTYHYQHIVISVPRCTKVFQEIRDDEIMINKRKGETLSSLAIAYQLTEVGICLALRRAEKMEYKQRLKSRHTKTIK